MELFLMGFLLWGLLIVGMVLLAVGLWRNSWRAMLWSGLALFVPAFLIAMDGGLLFKLALLVPIAIVGAAFWMKDRVMYFM